ncbi:MAG: glycosyltransferase family 8 protein [Lachnospiraceae bacterium]
MNILVTLDSNYVTPLCTMLSSLIRSNPRTAFDIYVAYAHLTEADFQRIGKAVDGSGSRIIGIRVPDSLFEKAPVLKRITKATYYRLFASMYLPETLERILYIDPDTLILRDISALYHLPFGDNFFAGCTHMNSFTNFVQTARLGMSPKNAYINAGILLINLRALRAFFSPNDVFDFVERHASTLFLADQDVLNALYGDRILPLDAEVYNCDERVYRRILKKFGKAGAESLVRQKTCILHYDGKYKPWKPNYKGELIQFYPHAARCPSKLLRTKSV